MFYSVYGIQIQKGTLPMTQAEIEEQIDVQLALARMMPAKAILSINAISILRSISRDIQAAKNPIKSA
jgi:hypothetical protein